MSRSCLEPLEGRRLMAGGTILFVRGAERSGGFLEAANDAQRTEQLADINNTSTARGNHGWGTLAAVLRQQGYRVEQIVEPLEADAPATGQTTGAPLDFGRLDLSKYAAVVLGSNNAAYGPSRGTPLENYVTNGGGLLVMSDGNFGSSWADSPSSDASFVGRFNLFFAQDTGTYVVRRSAGDFNRANNAILIGVDAFDGEGVSPVRVPDSARAERVARALGDVYDNNPRGTANDSRGTLRQATANDASLATTFSGAGRVAAFFDRNTFFNANGAGTDITRYDNRQLAVNLFNWVTDRTPPAVTSSGFAQGTRRLTFRLDDNLLGPLTRQDVRLRNRKTGQAIAGRDWSLSLSEGNGFTDVTIRINASVADGPYQLQVPRGALADDSNNVRRGAIRYAFTVAADARRPTATAASGRGVIAFARPTPAFDRPRAAALTDELLRSSPPRDVG